MRFLASLRFARNLIKPYPPPYSGCLNALNGLKAFNAAAKGG